MINAPRLDPHLTEGGSRYKLVEGTRNNLVGGKGTSFSSEVQTFTFYDNEGA